MKSSIEEQIRIITKGVQMVVSEEELRQKLEICEKEERPLRIKYGLDPSAPDIHLGHAVALRKLKQIQDLGHQVIIIIGDFTGKIGDPTGKSKGRNALSEEEVRENALTYQKQVFKVLDEKKTIVRYNGEWLSQLKFEDVLRLAATTTVARILERDDFQKRYSNQTPIGLHEFFYPLMQAYDSLAIDADMELGGTDQTFNVLMGRNLQKAMGKPQQVAMFMPILEGLDGVEKMSKSLGNYIGVNEEANVMFKKVMEVQDNLIVKYFELTTDEHPDKIEEIKKRLNEGENPKNIKLELARIITGLYHTVEEKEAAEVFYNEAFAKKAIPDAIPELKFSEAQHQLSEIMTLFTSEKLVASNSEFRRLLTQGGVQINGEKVVSLETVVHEGDVIKIGKKKFIKMIH